MCVGPMPSCYLDYEGCTTAPVCVPTATVCLVDSSLAGTFAAITKLQTPTHNDNKTKHLVDAFRYSALLVAMIQVLSRHGRAGLASLARPTRAHATAHSFGLFSSASLDAQ